MNPSRKCKRPAPPEPPVAQSAGQPSLRIVLAGSVDREEFREVPATLSAYGRVVHLADPREATDPSESGDCPFDLLVLLQSYPGEFPAETIERLRTFSPLARVIVVLGSWCEGEVRTGQPQPGVIRVYWHQWHTACRSELPALCQCSDSTWSLPATATDDDRLLLLANRPLPRASGPVAILAEQWNAYDWLADACGRCGYEPAWCRNDRSSVSAQPVLALVDVHGCESPSPAQVRRWLRRLGAVPAVGLFDFPRPHHIRLYRAAGITTAMSKPLVVDELMAELVRLQTANDSR